MNPSAKRLPALGARVMQTTLAAFVGVFLLILAVQLFETLRSGSGEWDREVLNSAQVLANALDDTHSEAEAKGAFALAHRVVLVSLKDTTHMPQLGLHMETLDGRFVQSFQVDSPVSLQQWADGLVADPQGPRLLYVANGQRWRVAVVDEQLAARRRWALVELARSVAFYLLLALPVVVVPVWWAVRRGLRPLRQLSQQIAQRSPHDLSPLSTTRSYREMLPLEQALNRLFDRVAQGLARERAFVHDAAHEMRTPLAVVATQATVLMRSEGQAREQAAERLQAAVTRSSHLTQQLLDLARADGEALHSQGAQQADLMNLVRDAMALLAEQAAAQGTELELDGPDQAPLQGDPRALRSIVDNLLDNALRYGGAAGLVKVEVRREAEAWLLCVSDQGPGIAAEHNEHVFERFWRGSDRPGTGLGLAIVRQTARAMGGEAWVENAARGAELRVRLSIREHSHCIRHPDHPR